MTPQALRERIKQGMPLEGLDLRGMDLPPGDYAGAILVGCDLRRMPVAGIALGGLAA
jgi:uncharacterized protein YjbI with pentapeptide repeats